MLWTQLTNVPLMLAPPFFLVLQVLDRSAFLCRVLRIPFVPSTELILRVRPLTVDFVFAFPFGVVGVFFWSRDNTLQL